MDSPPAKRRRFFTHTDTPTQLAKESGISPSKPIDAQRSRPGFSVKEEGQSLALHKDPSTGSRSARGGVRNHAFTHAAAKQDTAESAPMAFDQDTFEALVGQPVDGKAMATIRHSCGNDLEKAVNFFLDGAHEVKPLSKPASDHSASSPCPPPDPAKARPPTKTPTVLSPARRVSTKSRYIGSFGVDGWTTRGGKNLLQHGETVKIERHKILPPRPHKSSSKPGKPAVMPRGALSAMRRVDVIVRFCSMTGTELGRLSKEAADWVSTLMDQGICEFEGTCVYAPETLRTNDTVYLQLRCSLLLSAFTQRRFDIAIQHVKALPFSDLTENTEEKAIRLRQVALVRLFQEINLVPTTVAAGAAQSQRQGLLQSAEMADKRERELVNGASKTALQSNSPGSDTEDGRELEQDQLDALYKKAQSFDFDTPEAEPAASFAMNLRPYQKQALYWMIAKENNVKSDQTGSLHPLWEEYAWPTVDANGDDVLQVEGVSRFYLNPYSGELSLDFPGQDQSCLGGILADEMGLGKTIQMLSLIHSNPSAVSRNSRSGCKPLSGSYFPMALGGRNSIVPAPFTTLVVAPMTLLSQWQSEAEKASAESSLKTVVYYGLDKYSNLQALCCEANASSAPDLIITSYGVVLSEFSQMSLKKDKGAVRGLFSLNFFRVILDEAHLIKNRQSKTARACYEIKAEHRWLLTGTPIVNKLEDLFSLIRFLRVEPWNNFSFWKTFITLPFESGDFVKALDVVQTVLEPLVLRRTKDMKTPDVPLPRKHIETVEVELSEKERDVYDYIFHKAKTTLARNLEAGTVMKAFTTIFAQVLRLRQCCCHPVLVRNDELVADEEEAGAAADAVTGLADDMDLESLIARFTVLIDEQQSGTFEAHVLKQIRDEATHECPICSEEPMVQQMVTGCWHSCCKQCLLDYIKHETDRGRVPRCVSCREAINVRDLFEVVRYEDGPDERAEDQSRISLQRFGVNNSSVKVVTLIQKLRELRREDGQTKSVVFSQFTSFLTLIEPALARAGIRFVRLDGTMAQKSRAAVLDRFREAAGFTVLLISLRAGGVGLNLTVAKRVFMMDPWWSFAVEAQAIDRVHRMGQEDEVRVYRFIVKDSVEERMLRVQSRKKFICNPGNGGLLTIRPRATSLGMMTDEEKKLQRIEEIKELLS